LDAPGWVIPSSWANSVTGPSPARSSTRISRRCCSAIALKTSDVVAARAIAQSYSDIGIRQAGEEGAYRDEARVAAVLADLETAPIEEPLRATLRMLRKLTREHAVNANDIHEVLAARVSREQIEDALAVGFAFNTTNRPADAFGFFVPGPKGFESGAKFLLMRGYGAADGSRTPDFDLGQNWRRDQPSPENRSHADWRVIPRASPIRVQLIPRARAR
jgi:alkylhydroperoxidase family enzyme